MFMQAMNLKLILQGFVKYLQEQNLITEEEYNTRLSQLLENNAKQISGKVELVKKEETLQEKIAQIKNKDKEEK